MSSKKLLIKEIKKTFVLQQGQSDCGVACLLSLIRYYGGNNSLEVLREHSGTTRQGTTLLGLCQAANSLGFDSEGCAASMDALIDHGEPVILHVLIRNQLHHYVVCYGFRNNEFIIGDPAKGIVTIGKEELEKIWVTKHCLTLKPNSTFIQTGTAKGLKRKWLVNIVREDVPLLGISIVLGIFITVLGMVLPVFSQQLIDNILPSHNYDKLMLSIGIVSFLLIARNSIVAIRQSLLIQQGKDFNNRIIGAFYNTLLKLPKPFFDTRKTGEFVARLNDTERIQRVINRLVGKYVLDGLTAITCLVFLYAYSLKVGMVATISLPVYFYLIYRFNNKIIHAQKEVMSSYAFNESNYINSIQGVSVIKNFNREDMFAAINKIIYGSFQEKIFALGKINVRLTLLAGIAGTLFLGSIITISSLEVYYGVLKLGELMALLGVASSLLPSVANVALVAIPINEATVAFERMFEFVCIEQEKNTGEEIDDFNSLEMKNISFRYRGRGQLIKNASIRVGKNELIAVIGESGSGKSTLGQIIQGFYNIENGEIIVNERLKLDEVKSSSWRNMLGVVPQEIHLFNGTVLDNICLEDSSPDEYEKVIAFCNEMGLSYFIEQLPQSYMTILGETGINLSGGQKQIIALARVLYRKPKLLLLDEATSAMDRVTERFVLDLLQKLKQEMAIIFISHRLHLLKQISNRIYVLEDGEVTAKGTHQDLLLTSNLYSDYWRELAHA